MAIEDSRLKGGTLTLDGQPFAKQMTSVDLEPSVDTQGEALETLDGSAISPDEVTSWVLNLGAVQDFVDPAGFVKFSKDNAGDEVTFEWTPNADPECPAYAGIVKVRAVRIGGEVAQRLATTTAWPVVGEPDDTYPGP